MVSKFTLGMALFDGEPNGYETVRAKFTAMSGLLHHPLVGEVVVVDNNPKGESMLLNLSAKTGDRLKYVPMPEPAGTSAPRNKVFEVAEYDHVVVIDSHVFLLPGFFEALAAFYANRGEDCPDLLHGLMVNEHSQPYATHMNDQWRSDMWGTWGMAWLSRQGDLFSCVKQNENDLAYVTLGEDDTQRLLNFSEIKYLGLPWPLAWSGHERVLDANGCKYALDEPVKVPGHGMGFFACRKGAWLPFHAECRGFGGEEMTTHCRFRKAGRSAWCVPGARWWHDYERPGGLKAPPYPLRLWDRIRNYYLEFKRLGMDPAPVYAHFVERGRMPRHEWDQLVAGADWPVPVANDKMPLESIPGQKVGSDPSTTAESILGATNRNGRPSLVDLYLQAREVESNLKAEVPILRDLASRCGPDDGPGRVCELAGPGTVSTVALMAGRPIAVMSFRENEERFDAITSLDAVDHEGTTFGVGVKDQVFDCDFLFINRDPDANKLYQLLMSNHQKVSRFIAVHDTVRHGEKFNGKHGALPAVRAFVQKNPDWFVAAHHTKGNGLTVLSKDKRDWPRQPINIGVTQPLQQSGGDIGEGPGTELLELFKSMGVVEKPGCDCRGMAARMNQWGPAGCRQNMNTIVGFLQDGLQRWGWAERVTAAFRTVGTGLVFKVNPWDPLRSVVEEAIRRAEEKQGAVK